MKKSLYLIPALLLLFSACGRNQALDSELLKKAEKADELYAPAKADFGDEYYGSWTEETSYDAPDVSQYEGIVTHSSGTQGYYDGKYYFTVTKKYQGENTLTTSSTQMYIDLATGESHYVCPDPLCSHVRQNEEACGSYSPFALHIRDGRGYTFVYSSQENAMWLETITLMERDLATGETKALYSVTNDHRNNEAKSENIIGIDGSLLWYYEIETVTDDESKTQTAHRTVYSYNLETGEFSAPYPFPAEYDQEEAGFFGEVRNGVFYMCSPQTRLFSTDKTFSERKILIDEPMPSNGRDRISYHVSDENTGELFLLYGNKSDRTGWICRIVGGEIEELTMPHEEIYQFRLTKDKIYYMIYADPEDAAKWDGEDYGGGKIYVTDRETRKTAELFFDSGMEIPLRDSWNVIGNYVYVSITDYTPGSDHPFSGSFNRKMARIHVSDGTIRYFRFE